MGPVQLVAAIIAFGVTAVAVWLFVRAIGRMVRVLRIGQPVDAARTAGKGRRAVTMLRETLGHTRMLKWTGIGAAHWFVMVAFGVLLFTLIEAYGDTVDPRFVLPLIGGWVGVAWHRFSAFFNIFFKRSQRPALGALQPMMSGGRPLDFEEADPDTDVFGVAAVEQFTWKGLLDFSTCTECGRCQSQCPAWNTAKPLSPKLLVLSLRDHAYAKAPYLLNADTASAQARPRRSGR